MVDDKARPSEFVEALAKGIAVIECFDAAHADMTLSEIARRVGLSPAAARRRPFALERRLVALKAAPGMEAADFNHVPPGAWLLEHVAWTEAESRISAVNADADNARLLALDEGAACLVVDRRTWREGQHVTRVRQVFPGEAYDLVARFGPGA